MRFKFLLFLFPFVASFTEEIEVRLKTALDLTPIYVTRMAKDSSESDWRYLEELRNILEFDLNTSGFFAVLPIREEWEQTLNWPEVKREFDLSVWKNEKIPFVLAVCVFNNTLQISAFNIEKGTSKRYQSYLITRRLETDRKELHKICDLIQKDLIGVEGIASLRLIYSQRERNSEKSTMEWLSEIWISDSDGANAEQVTFENDYCVTPSFFPGTAHLIDPSFFYVCFKTGQSKIYRSSLHLKARAPLVDLRGNQLLPSLNAKGTQMAFIADAAGRPDLFVQNFDPTGRKVGKSRQLFSAPRATQASPTFSPDGKKLAFVSDKDGPPRIYLIDILSSKETRRAHPQLLTKKNRENTSPAWSPDGKKIAYSAKIEGIRQIWIYDFETDEEIPLTTGAFNKENPAWAPDSLHLVYNTDFEEEGQLYLINLRQREPVQITKGAGQKRFPSWETR